MTPRETKILQAQKRIIKAVEDSTQDLPLADLIRAAGNDEFAMLAARKLILKGDLNLTGSWKLRKPTGKPATVKPISPADVCAKKIAAFPDEVLEAFNELIVENFNLNLKYSTVMQEDVVKRISAKLQGQYEVFNNGWLDVETLYQSQGWEVTYDKPAYCEDYKAYFKFSLKKGRS